MPVEPAPTPWSFGDPARFDARDDLVGVGADLAPGTLLAAYRQGLFPMPSGQRGDPMYWFCPVHRGVLPLDGVHVSRSLRRSMRSFEVRVDTAFEEVLDACADPRRPSGWIDGEIREAYLRLHDLGWAHSVETWREGRLVGGLYGVASGGLFAGESMFHRETDASKAALVALVDLLDDEHAADRLLDVQWSTPHLASLGVIEIGREEYLRRLARAVTTPLPAALDDSGLDRQGMETG
ncbi:Leucyl/phenylalanyl-tRNA--protein transferase [Nocardioides dokdonensis FR1436]|uniref:Leucyl/phenylalanyl-tRNA--protein transferase n=1 Tax=Nocardioides dokdonensis FR1436 TaxID=1300347 RepID=A0A1A9GJZ3_9ACTN|nr:leucyl/phenylalanyl-tRNA--protein transferase [Nocardioides dokdonensis]ANH37811.1 Leucyl/phenylalanyl-tRNA--protein transferase [Nocardioides dokdonensis FR1436]